MFTDYRYTVYIPYLLRERFSSSVGTKLKTGTVLLTLKHKIFFLLELLLKFELNYLGHKNLIFTYLEFLRIFTNSILVPKSQQQLYFIFFYLDKIIKCDWAERVSSLIKLSFGIPYWMCFRFHNIYNHFDMICEIKQTNESTSSTADLGILCRNS